MFCLDPSCFVTLQRLEDTLKTLDDMTKEQRALVYIPTDIYNVIMLEPEMKFKKLPNVIKDWLLFDQKNDIREMNEIQKNTYVNTMRDILRKFNPLPANAIADNITKLGTDSIHRSNVLDMFGEIKGKILFEIMTISSKLNAKIIAFGRKTARFLRRLKITTIESASKLKHEIKINRKIQTGLVIMLFAMGLPEIREFINSLQLEPFPFELTSTASLGAFGVLMIGNGK